MVTRTGIEPMIKNQKSVGIQRFFKIRVKWRVKFVLFYLRLTQRSFGNPAPVLQCLSAPDVYIFCASFRHLPTRQFSLLSFSASGGDKPETRSCALTV